MIFPGLFNLCKHSTFIFSVSTLHQNVIFCFSQVAFFSWQEATDNELNVLSHTVCSVAVLLIMRQA
jgi:hypothetical protein